MLRIIHNQPGGGGGGGTDDQTAEEVPTDASGFNNNLSAADVNVQLALDTLDDITFGDVVGPASATDNAVARYDLTTGKLLQDSLVTIDNFGGANFGSTVTIPAANFLYVGKVDASNYVQTQGLIVTNYATISTGVDLTMTGGNIDLTAGATIATVTGAELNTLTDGSDASSLHTHTNFSIGFDGYVPGPLSETGKYLKDDGTWDTPAGGGGDVTGPGTSTDNAVALWDGTGGDTLSDSNILESELETLTDGSNADSLHVHSYAPIGAEYVTVSSDGDLTAEHVLVGGNGITVTDGAGTVTLSLSPSEVGTTELEDEAVTNAKLAHMAQSTIKGRAAAAGTGDATDLSVAQVKTVLDYQASDIDTNTANFDNNLSAADDTVQKALETLDEMSGGGAPETASYICVETGSNEIGLTNERTLEAAAGFSIADFASPNGVYIRVQDYTVLTYVGSTVTPDPSGGSTGSAKFSLAITKDTTIAYPSGTISTYWRDGQFVEYRITQDSTGGWEVTWAAAYETGEIPSVQIAQGANETTYVLMKWNSGHASMDIVSIARGYS